jgi:hypothetical protein
MTYEMGLHPSATGHKCDFQCYTPRHCSWKRSPDLSGGDSTSELARQQWAESFIAAAGLPASSSQTIMTFACRPMSWRRQRLKSKLRIFLAVEIAYQIMLIALLCLISR